MRAQSGADSVGRIHQNRRSEPKLRDGCRDLRNLLIGVRPGVPLVRLQPIHRPDLDPASHGGVKALSHREANGHRVPLPRSSEAREPHSETPPSKRRRRFGIPESSRFGPDHLAQPRPAQSVGPWSASPSTPHFYRPVAERAPRIRSGQDEQDAGSGDEHFAGHLLGQPST